MTEKLLWWGLKQDGEIVAVLRSSHPLQPEDFDVPLNEGCEYTTVAVSALEIVKRLSPG